MDRAVGLVASPRLRTHRPYWRPRARRYYLMPGRGPGLSLSAFMRREIERMARRAEAAHRNSEIVRAAGARLGPESDCVHLSALKTRREGSGWCSGRPLGRRALPVSHRPRAGRDRLAGAGCFHQVSRYHALRFGPRHTSIMPGGAHRT